MNDDKQPVFATAAEYYSWWLQNRAGYPGHQDIFEAGMAHARSLAASPAHTESAAPVDEHGLLPCPFCNGTPELKKTAYGMPVMKWVACKSCEASATAYETAASAYASWNQRANHPAPSPVSGADERAARSDDELRGEVAYQLHTRNRFLDMPTTRAIVDSAFDAAIAKRTLPGVKAPDEGQIDALNEAICWARDEGLPGTADHLRDILAALAPTPSGQQALSAATVRNLVVEHAVSWAVWDDSTLHKVDFGDYGFQNFVEAILATAAPATADAQTSGYAVRVCEESDVQCSRGCGAGPCAAMQRSGQ